MTIRSGLAIGIGACAFLVSGIAAPTTATAQGTSVRQVLPGRPQIEPRPSATESTQQGKTDVSIKPPAIDDSCALRDPAYADTIVTITAVSFDPPPGADPLAPELLAALRGVSAPAGRQQVGVVCDVRDQANAALARAGLLASVQIPPQEIADGTLRLTVVAATIREIHIIGNVGQFRALLEKRAAAIQAMRPVRIADVRRLLVSTGDIPGLRVQLALRSANTVPGEVIGDLIVDAQPAVVLANVQNTGARQLGPTLGSLRADVYGVTGLADRTFIAFSNTTQWDEAHLFQAGHDMAIGSSGLRTGIRASFALSQPTIPNLDLRTRSLILGWDISMPLLRDVDRSIRASGGFELLNQRTRFYQGGTSAPFTRDKLRVAYARIDGSISAVDSNSREPYRANGYVQLRHGLDIFGASQAGPQGSGYQLSRFDGDPGAFVAQGELVQTLRHGAAAIEVSAFGQWANHPLLNVEEFSLGNLTYGRGYDPSVNGGDRAVALRVEPRLRLPQLRWLTAELFGFFDYVKLWNLDSGAIETNRRFRSWGGGVRLGIARQAALDITYAKPIDRALRDDTRNPPARLLISLTTKLYPWGGIR